MSHLLHMIELGRELMKPGELAEWKIIDSRDERRILRGPLPKDSSCYPYHQQLSDEQLVGPEDFH